MQDYEEKDASQKLNIGLWRRLLRYAKPFYPHLFGIGAAMTVCTVIDVIYPLLTRDAIDNYIALGQSEGMAAFGWKFFLISLTQAVTVAIFCLLSGRVEVGLCHRIREIGFERLQALPFSFFDRTPIGYVIARMTSDTQRIGDIVGWGLIDLLWGAAMIVFSIIAMFRLNASLALAVVAVMPLIALATVYFQKRILKSYRETRKLNSQITGAFNEGIMGARTTKTLVREDRNMAEFAETTGRMRKASVRAAVLSALFLPVVISLSALSAAYILWKGGYQVFTGALSFGTLTAFVSYATKIFEPIQDLARIFAEMLSAQAAAERVVTLIETEPEIADTKAVTLLYGDSFRPHPENWPPMKGHVRFEDVSFAYASGETVLSHFDLTVKAGQTIALVGETGAGKSTIVNLLCRFYEPTSGRVLIDGADYRKRSILWLESHLGYVLQDPHLFSGTVRENIRYGRLDATDEEVEAAARRAYAEDFIVRLDKEYETDVGESGGRLSTGQRQLVSFARALLADPRLLVLDEATSSVDTETEQKIQAAISVAREGRTCFVIAHRLSTIRTADCILVIDQGRIAESGSHAELMRKKGAYYNLYVNQFREERERALVGKA